MDPYLIVRAAAVYLAVMSTCLACVWRRPHRRALTGALLASMWNLPAVLAVNVAAARAGWWRFHAEGGLLLGVPVDFLLSWSWLWGAVPALAFSSLPIAAIVTAAASIDVLLMPAAAPVLILGRSWLIGEALALFTALVPAQLVARWTERDEQLAARVALQVVAFAGLVLLLVPAIAIESSRTGCRNPLTRSPWELSLIAQALAMPAIFGLTAVHEFVTRGGGTPVPFDPPRRLVTTGVYAYVRNPMQLSAVVLLVAIGAIVANPWISAAGVVAHIYSVGLAGWDEDEDLQRRFGTPWRMYRVSVRRWVPRLRPWFRPDQPPARLFVAQRCGMCAEVGRWFDRRGVCELVIAAAETHASGALRRITYEPADGSPASSGVAAVGRALEHVHIGWAMVGFTIRLPVVRSLLQLLVDASGAEPRLASDTLMR